MLAECPCSNVAMCECEKASLPPLTGNYGTQHRGLALKAVLDGQVYYSAIAM